MRYYRRNGERVRMAERTFLMRQVREVSYRLLLAARTLVENPPIRHPDARARTVRGDAFTWLDRMVEAETQIDDGRLRGQCAALRDRVTALLDLDSEALDNLAAHAYSPASSRKSLAVFDAAWVLDQDIAGRIRELVEAAGREFKDSAARYAPIPRPVDQLRASIETLRAEIRQHAETSERLAGIIARRPPDLPSSPDKDSDTP